jgi:hypothetical protein
MAKLKARLAALAKSLGVQKPLLARARRRTKKDHERAVKAEKARDRARAQADDYRAEAASFLRFDDEDSQARGQALLRRARRRDRKAAAEGARALKFHRRAARWAERVRVLFARVEGIRTSIAGLEAEIAEFERKHRVTFAGNKAKGGTAGKRWLATWALMCANCVNGVRRNFYSQVGGPDIKHEIEPGPAYGCRSDCSSSITGAAWTCGLPDPNGLKFSGYGYTGTLVQEHNGWRQCSLAEMREKGWGYVIYGGGTGFHVEAFTPSESNPDQSSGHGDAAVNRGSLFMFGSVEMRFYIYDPKG